MSQLKDDTLKGSSTDPNQTSQKAKGNTISAEGNVMSTGPDTLLNMNMVSTEGNVISFEEDTPLKTQFLPMMPPSWKWDFLQIERLPKLTILLHPMIQIFTSLKEHNKHFQKK